MQPNPPAPAPQYQLPCQSHPQSPAEYALNYHNLRCKPITFLCGPCSRPLSLSSSRLTQPPTPLQQIHEEMTQLLDSLPAIESIKTGIQTLCGRLLEELKEIMGLAKRLRDFCGFVRELEGIEGQGDRVRNFCYGSMQVRNMRWAMGELERKVGEVIQWPVNWELDRHKMDITRWLHNSNPQNPPPLAPSSPNPNSPHTQTLSLLHHLSLARQKLHSLAIIPITSTPYTSNDQLLTSLNSSILTIQQLQQQLPQDPKPHHLSTTFQSLLLTFVETQNKNRVLQGEYQEMKRRLMEEIEHFKEEIRVRRMAENVFEESALLRRFVQQREVMEVLGRVGVVGKQQQQGVKCRIVFAARSPEESQEFINSCHAKKNLLVVMRTASGETYAAFTHNGWNMQQRLSTQSFLFPSCSQRPIRSPSFLNPSLQHDFIFPLTYMHQGSHPPVFKSNPEMTANSWKRKYGPVFGNFDLAVDKKMRLCWTDEPRMYPDLSGMFEGVEQEGKNRVKLMEYEVMELEL